MASSAIDQFQSAIAGAGLPVPERIEADGVLHRFSTNGRASDDSGWYVLHDGRIPAGAFGCWRSGLHQTWRADIGRKLDADEEREHRRRLAEIRRQRDQERARRQEDAAKRASELWESAALAADHEYLRRKGVQAHGLRVGSDGRLLVPMRDADGRLVNIQRIGGDGEKRFLLGGRVTGTYHAIGAPKGIVYVAEGYATAASVYEATGQAVACAFNAGNLAPVAKVLRAKFPEARIIIAGDHDVSDTGQTAAMNAAQAVNGEVAIPADPGDWNDVHAARGIEAVREGLDARKTPRVEPEPLRRPLPPAEPYPLDALGDVLGAAAQRMRDTVQAPDALCGQSVLAAASLAVQAHADVLVDGRREPLSLWAVTIAESGERKSAVDRIALEPHREHERAALAEYKHARKLFELDAQAFEAASRAASRGKDPDAIRAALGKLGAAPEPPVKPIWIVGTPTIEGLHKLYKFGQPSLGLFHDDAAEFLAGHAMSDDNRAKSAAGLSRLWDSGEFDRIRAADGAEKFFGRRLAMHLLMQPVIAERILSDDVMTGQGFLARTLLAWPSSTIGTRRYAEIDVSADPVLERYRRTMRELLERPPRMVPETTNELEPRALTLSPSAKRRWIAVHDAIESDMSDGGEYASIRAWASKAPSQTLRIAGVLTLVSDPDASQIEAEEIDRAATLVLFALGEAVRIVGTAAVPVEIRNAEALLAWCHTERIKLLHSGAALQFGPAPIRTKRAFDAAMAELERAGWAAPIEGGCEVDGAHRRRVWAVRSES